MISLILAAILAFVQTTLAAFWPWLLGGAGAVLAFLFSPTLRKYTIAIIAIALILGITFLGGYNSNHTVQTVTHSCTDFRKVLVNNSATDKAISIFKRHGLCQ